MVGLAGVVGVLGAGGLYTYKMVTDSSKVDSDYKLADESGIEIPTSTAAAPIVAAAAYKRSEEDPAAATEPVDADCGTCCLPPKTTLATPETLSRRDPSAVGTIAPPTRVVNTKCGRCCKPKVKVSPNDTGALV